MKMEFPYCNLLKMTASEGRERDVEKTSWLFRQRPPWK